MSVRKFLKHVGVTSQRVIEEAVRSGKVEGSVLKVRMTLKSDNAQSSTSSKLTSICARACALAAACDAEPNVATRA